jgi:hypothetical protein
MPVKIKESHINCNIFSYPNPTAKCERVDTFQNFFLNISADFMNNGGTRATAKIFSNALTTSSSAVLN